jgi:hypothetical protein
MKPTKIYPTEQCLILQVVLYLYHKVFDFHSCKPKATKPRKLVRHSSLLFSINFSSLYVFSFRVVYSVLPSPQPQCHLGPPLDILTLAVSYLF